MNNTFLLRKSFLILLFAIILLPYLSGQCLSGDCQNGIGVLKFKSGTTYIGEFEEGKFQGVGVLLYTNGNKFIGRWENDMRSGYGKLLLSNGTRYEGEFLENKFDGYGTFQYGDKSVFSGMWTASYPNGPGKYKRSENEIIEGIWQNGSLSELKNISSLIKGKSKKLRNCNRAECNSGLGTFDYEDGSRWEGQFFEGNPEGVGMCTYSNGDVYFGLWDEDKPDGFGSMYYSGGKKLTTVWNQGQPAKEEDAREEKAIVQTNNPFNKQVKIWAVIIGTSRYENLPTLKYTDDDAYQIYAFLKSPEGGAVPDEQLKILIDESATRDNIMKTIKNTFYQADKNDVVFLYFAGHGINGYYLPTDSDGYKNKISYDEIKRVLETTEAKHKICIADACYSGSLLAQRSAYGESLDLFYSTFEKTKGGTAFLLSSKHEEVSLESSGVRHGIFSHFLLEGLKGGADINSDKIITIKELYDFVYKNVRQYSGETQTPVIAGNYDDNMPVGVVRF
ncbi:MAG TPA: caspase family protein [Saprospiraceae bacterium]|nr:caspase family protein [Saprospiraceae bacterium]